MQVVQAVLMKRVTLVPCRVGTADAAKCVAADRLPTPTRPGHDTRVPKVVEIVYRPATFFAPAVSCVEAPGCTGD